MTTRSKGTHSGIRRHGVEWIIGQFTLDVAAGQLQRDGTTVPLRPKTFQLLVYLSERPGILVGIPTLLDAIWPNVHVTTKTLNNAISELRLALGDTTSPPRFIETMHRRGYRFLAPVEVRKRERNSGGPETRRQAGNFIGRSAELDDLRFHFQRALAGSRQIVFLTGDPGIGKSTLIASFLTEIEPSASEPWIARGNCVDVEGVRESYGPFLEALEHLLTRDGAAALEDVFTRCAPSWMALLPHFGERRPYADIANTTAARMLREGAALLEAISAERPLVLILEDLHWADRATIDLLALLARRSVPARLLVLATARAHESGAEHVAALARDLRQHQLGAELALKPLTVGEQHRYLSRFFGAGTAGRLAPFFDRWCGGNPLFLGLAVEDLLTHRDRDELNTLTDPQTLFAELPLDLRDLIERRLKAYPPEQIELLETASVCGMDFSTELVARVLDKPARNVERSCREIAARTPMIERAGGSAPVLRRGERYLFRHVLYQRVLYERLLPSRRDTLHLRAGTILEQAAGVGSTEIAGELARHFSVGGNQHKAAIYAEQAAMIEIRRSAYGQAAAQYERALEHVRTLDASDANREWEARLLLALVGPLLTQPDIDFAKVEECSQRARALYERLGQPRNAFRCTMALVITNQLASRFDEAARFGEELIVLANHALPTLRAQAQTYHATTLNVRGEFEQARTLLEGALGLEAEPGIPVLIDLPCLIFGQLGVVLAPMGESEGSRHWCERATDRARAQGNVVDRVSALAIAAVAAAVRGDEDTVVAMVREVESIDRKYGLPPIGHTAIALGAWAAARTDPERLSRLRHLLHGTEIPVSPFRSLLFALLAERELAYGEVDAARTAIERGLAFEERSGARWYQSELLRLQAECSLAGIQQPAGAGDIRAHRSRAAEWDTADALLQRAVEIARQQRAHLWEQRALAAHDRLLAARRQDTARGA